MPSKRTANTRADEYVVIGNPVDHSLSPRIHGLFARQTGCHIHYSTLLSERHRFSQTAGHFFEQGGRGANITVPFKEEASRFVDQLTERARLAGAVNTIKRHPEGHCEGDTTDGTGLLRDLQHNLGLELAGARILMLGAGGAACSVTQALLAASPASLVVANRTADKAVALADRFCDMGEVRGLGLAAAAQHAPYDLIINATSAGLAGSSLPALPSGLLADNTLAYDMIYADQPTAFLRWATEQGAPRCVDGLGMLLEQAAESFWLWRGRRPATGPVHEALRPAANAARSLSS